LGKEIREVEWLAGSLLLARIVADEPLELQLAGDIARAVARLTGARIQNLLSILKIVMIVGLAVLALLIARRTTAIEPRSDAPGPGFRASLRRGLRRANL